MTNKNPKSTKSEVFTNIARIAAGGYDDAQQNRISVMNRVRDIVRKKNEDIDFDEVKEEKEDRKFEKKYQDENIGELLEQMLDEEKITKEEHKYIKEMLEIGQQAEKVEGKYKDIMSLSKKEPIWNDFLAHVNGIGPVLTSKLLHKLSYCKDQERVSHLWSYAGLTPDSKREQGEQLNFDPELKTLAWLCADRIIMQGDKSLYKTKFYDPYKKKQVNRMEMAEDMTEEELNEKKWTPPKSQGHAHNRAVRYLAKKFLKHYWAIARDIKGFETPDEYIIAYGGHKKKTDDFENPFYAKRAVKGR